MSSIKPHLFYTLHMGRAFGDFCRFIAAESQVPCAHDYHRHSHINTTNRHPINFFLNNPGRQQRPALGSHHLTKAEPHRRPSPRHPVYTLISFIRHSPSRRLDDGVDSTPGVDIEDPNPGLVGIRRHQPKFNGKRPNPCQHVPAGRRRIDDGLVEPNLRKPIVDIDTRPLRRTDHRHLARHRGGASEPVDLTRVG